MKKFEYKEVLVYKNVLIKHICDGCGISEEDADLGLVEVEISINEGQEGGRTDSYDYCNDCILERASIFIAAGSRAPYITGEEIPFSDDLNEE